MGFLPEAMRNYLLRLGWGHGDVDIISTEDAIKLFDISDIGRSPSRFDMAKLTNMNGHYIRAADDARLVPLAVDFMQRRKLLAPNELPIDDARLARLERGIGAIKQRAKTLIELAEGGAFYVRKRPIPIGEPARKLLNEAGVSHIRALIPALTDVADWTEAATEAAFRAYVEAKGVKMGEVAQPLRAALTGQSQSPGLFEVMAALSRDETLGRLADAVK
jgi:glutamyl-tRNA synthetase